MKEIEEFHDRDACRIAVKKMGGKIMLCKRCGQLSTKIFVYAFKLHSIDATLLNFFLSYLLVFFYVGIFSCF